MSFVMFGSARGAPGVTTAVLGVASCWRGATVVEADEDGGVCAARFGLAREPGLLSMAYRSARSELSSHVQLSPIGVPVVVGPEAPGPAAAAWAAAGAAITATLVDAATAAPVVVDGGRMRGDAAVTLVQRAALVVVFTRPDAGDVASTAALIARLRAAGAPVSLAVVGDGAYRADEVATVLGCELGVVLPADARAAARLWAGDPSVARSPLARAWRTLAQRCAAAAAGPVGVGLVAS